MAALLYKEYVAIRGKWLVLSLLALTGLFAIATWCIRDDELLILLHIFVSCISMCGMLLISMGLFPQVVASESTWRQKAYLHATPISKKTYIASKYWFILILIYVMYSCTLIWYQIVSVKSLPGDMGARVSGMYAIIEPFLFACITIAAIEFPFALLYGKQKAELVKSTIVALFGLVLVTYFFFGDLSILEKTGDGLIYLMEHPTLVMVVTFFSNVIGLAAYYLSYRITVHFYEKEACYGDE